MPITQLTPQEKIDEYMENEIRKLERKIIRKLSWVGEQVLNVARSTNSYKDQTGNLRSSIGYIVAANGRVVKMSSFEVVKEGADGSKGGKEYARQLISQYPSGFCLIVVAGMRYAYFVSRNYDVLDSSELEAETLVPQVLKQLGIDG